MSMQLANIADLNSNYSRFIDSILGGSNRAIKGITTTSKVLEKLDKVVYALGQRTINIDIKKTESQSQGTKEEVKKSNPLMGYAKKLMSKDNLTKGMDLADEYMGIYGQIKLMNGGLEDIDSLQGKIFAAAGRAYTPYNDMASSMIKMNAATDGVFDNNDELIAFTELSQKAIKLGGGDENEQNVGMDKLIQAMSTESVGEKQLVGIMNSAPKIAEAISTYTGKSKEELQRMAAQGDLTADLIKNSILSMSADINSDFGKLPATFGDIWTQIKDTALKAFAPIINGIAEVISSDNFQGIVESICGGLNRIVQGMSLLAQGAMWIVGIIIDQWGRIGPIVWGIVAAIIAYNAISLITNGILAAQAVIEGIKATMTAAQASSTFLATVAQSGLNAALLACPLTWIIILVISLIAAFYSTIGAINKLMGTSISATGIIAAVFMGLVTTIGNMLIQVINLIIDSGAIIWNYIAMLAEFFANVFDNPIGSIIRLFVNMADVVLQVLESIASACDTIFGSNMAEAVGGWRDGLKKMTEDLVGEPEVKITRMDASKYRLDRIDTDAAVQKAYEGGENLFKFDKEPFKFDKILPEYNSGLPGLVENPTGMPKEMPTEMGITNVGGQPLDVAIDQDDIKYIQDLAERDYVAKFGTATLAPNISVSFGDVHESMDIHQVQGHVARILREEIAMVGEG